MLDAGNEKETSALGASAASPRSTEMSYGDDFESDDD